MILLFMKCDMVHRIVIPGVNDDSFRILPLSVQHLFDTSPPECLPELDWEHLQVQIDVAVAARG